MICPKCEEGTIVAARLKKTGASVMECTLCDTLWLAGEEISATSGHAKNAFSNADDKEYGLEELPEKDQEHEEMPERQNKT